ncbi:MAG: metal-dependent hydrolase [Chitinophagaceae bacterium]
MDSITHIALGACIGEAFFEKGFGKKAMLWGALAQSAPDIDFIAGAWMGLPEELLAHRGFTHSILFGLLIGPAFALLAARIHRSWTVPLRKWIWFFCIEIFVHLLLDGFNNYGVGWFEPFSHHRFSFNALYVADPFFSIWPAIALVVLLLKKAEARHRTFWWRLGLFIPLLYLTYCSYNKWQINRDVKHILAHQQIPYTRYFTTPTPLNNWLWYVVAGNDSGYNVGYRSVFDSKKEIDFHFFPRNDAWLDPLRNTEDMQRLIRFSQQFYTVEQWGDTLVFNDLRFGQITGWQNGGNRFVFHYFLTHPEANGLVVQRGRFAGWNARTARAMLRRIRGN